MWTLRHSALAAVAALAVIAAPRLIEAQAGTITGVVIDAETKQPLEGATVHVQGTNYGTETRPNGSYTIIGVPPGTYTVTARRLGYQAVDRINTPIAIDVTRRLDFELSAAAATLGAVTIDAPPVPLVEQGVVGSTTSITSEMISALPVTSISEVLALQQGYQEIPQNTNLVSLAEERRNTTASFSIRGGRGGSSITLVDGIPVNNPVFGSSAINVNTTAIAALDFSPGYMDAQYGNGMGIQNSAIREGGERFQGSLDYQTSAIMGVLGSSPDELLNQHLFRGYISGPVPGTDSRLRYMLSGQMNSARASVLRFDNSVRNFDQGSDTNEWGQNPQTLDLEAGWRAFGGRQDQQVVGKVTFLPAFGTKLTFTMVDQARQTMTYDRRYFLTYGGDPWSRVSTLMDSLGVRTSRNLQHIVQGSVRDQSQLYGVRFEKAFQRSNFSVSYGQTGLKRLTCNIWQGVCTTDRYWRPNFNENFISTFTPTGVPYFGTDLFYGGEDYTTRSVRSDFVTQATDHHRILVGASYTFHDVEYNEIVGLRGNSGVAQTVTQLYRAKPIEISSYLQDNIEYDFLAIRVGLRYDYGLAKGKGFASPLNATNGTTAREVCNGTAPGISETPFTYQGPDGLLTGVLACVGSAANAEGKPILLDSATRLAQVDDFKDAEARTAFSPRIGLAFPLTERSQLYFNAGRYTRNPSLHDVYRNSGVGTTSGLGPGTDNFCDGNAVKPGTDECHPPMVYNQPEFIGNPNLLAEQTTSYEVGYAGQIGNDYAITATVFNSDASGLTGIRANDSYQDIGSTYNGIALPDYSIAVNQDFLTSRGMSIGFQRRVVNRWGYNINYGWSRTTENSPPPDRQFEAEDANELNQGNTLRESISGRDAGHRLNSSIFLAFGPNDAPDIWGGRALKNSRFALTYSWSSGQVYTPQRTFGQSGIVNTITASDLNTGRGPARQSANLSYNKNLLLGNARYGLTVRVSNVFNIRNCNQVFANTGNCSTGVREFSQRRVGNQGATSEGTSTNRDQPENLGAMRRFFTGLTVTF